MGQLAEWEKAGLAEVEVLPRGLRESGHGIPEGLHCPLSAGLQEGHAVVCVLRGTDPVSCYTEPHLWDGPKPAVEGPRHEKVHGWGKGATLPHPCFPLAGLRDPAVHNG